MKKSSSLNIYFLILTTLSLSFGDTVSFEYKSVGNGNRLNSLPVSKDSITFDTGVTIAHITDQSDNTLHTTQSIHLVSKQHIDDSNFRVGLFNNQLDFSSGVAVHVATALFSFHFENSNNSLEITNNTTFNLTAYSSSKSDRYKNIGNSVVHLAVKSNGQWYVHNQSVNIPTAYNPTQPNTVAFSSDDSWSAFDANNIDSLGAKVKTSEIGSITDLGFYTKAIFDNPISSTWFNITKLNVENLELTAIP